MLAIALVVSTIPGRCEPRVTPFDELHQDGDGWVTSSWFGRYHAPRFPWIFHDEQGWLFVGEDSTKENLYIHDPVLGWLFTNEEVYPRVYSFLRSSWLQWTETGGANRRFFDLSLEESLDYPLEKEALWFRPPNGFELDHAIIPRTEIFHGGPARDGIPAILEPRFLSIPEVDYMESGDLLLSMTVGDETRAYPFRILNWHEIVNDQIGDEAFAVTYCPLCGTAATFNRRINDRILTFGVSGLLYFDNVLMYDHQTESLWSQLFLQSVTGPQFRTRLEWVDSRQMNWAAWKEAFPDGKVLSTETGFNRAYDRNPYAGYEEDDRIFFPIDNIRDDLEIKDWVYGVLLDGKEVSIPRKHLAANPEFDWAVDNSTVLSVRWDAVSGEIRVTDAAGETQPGIWSFWFSWQAFYPETLVWTP
ncbi:MAG: DUF3179 domain-containing protein [Verrucomicrobiota bacterium]